MQPEPTETEAELAKLKRRQKRNLRKAGAEGFLAGVAAMLRPGDLVLDCGANVGNVTAPLAETGADVHCFEPDPWAFAKLSERFADTPNVILYNVAVGVEAGHISLMRAENFDANPEGGSVKSTILEGGRAIDEDTAIQVELIDFPARLRALVAERGDIALLKMDIEGAELDILERMEAECLFEHIRCTLVETHERKFKHLRPRFKALKERMAATYPQRKVNLEWI